MCIACCYNPLCREVYFSHSQLPKGGFCWHGEQPWGLSEQWDVLVTASGVISCAKVTSKISVGESRPFSVHWALEQRATYISGCGNPLDKGIAHHQHIASQTELHSKGDRFTKTRVVGWRTHSLLPRTCGLVVHAHPEPGTLLTGWLHHPPRQGSSLQWGAGCRELWGEPTRARGAWGGWLLSPLISAAEVTPAGSSAARQPAAWGLADEGRRD